MTLCDRLDDEAVDDGALIADLSDDLWSKDSSQDGTEAREGPTMDRVLTWKSTASRSTSPLRWEDEGGVARGPGTNPGRCLG